MSLSCSCDFDQDQDDFEEWYYYPDDFTTLNRKRRKRCKSCDELIDIGACCIEFERCRRPLSDIEERISGDIVQIAPYYHCEKCAEIAMNLIELKYCVNPEDNMNELLKEYHEMTGFKRQGFSKQHG
jgi:hypothetical protein